MGEQKEVHQRVSDARSILFDIESTNLKANFGYCLAFGYKPLGGKTKVLSVLDYKHHKNDPTNDAALMKAAHKVLTEDADIIVTYYGKGFDRKFLNTRMIMAGLSPLPPLSAEHVDLYYTARGNLALNSNRLASVANALGCPFEKTVLDGPTWVRGSAGDPKAIKYIIEHCARDVDVLEYCYLKLRPFVRQHPPISEVKESCTSCGKYRWTLRGTRLTSKGRIQRYQCGECGRWA